MGVEERREYGSWREEEGGMRESEDGMILVLILVLFFGFRR